MTIPRASLIILLIVIVGVAIGGPSPSHTQSLIGSPGAGWQSWTPATDLNNNAAPYWDVPWGASGSYGGSSAEKNAGFCMTSTGDCQGIGSALTAPGPISFWGMPYDAAHDTGGARDNSVYFHHTGGELKAELYLNASAVTTEINEFGWVEVQLVSNVPQVGTRHMLFQGTGEPPGSLTPDPVGKKVTFKPTQYFAYYYSDVSEPTGTPPHGCYAYTLFNLDEPRCVEATGHQGDHDFVVFSKNPASEHAIYWVVGEDPADCTSKDGDCNMTIVKVSSKED